MSGSDDELVLVHDDVEVDVDGDGDVEVDGDGTGAVRTLTLNRPARLNAFTAASYRALATSLDSADSDPSVRVVILGGAGRAFSSGVDLDAVAGDGQVPSELASTFDGLLESLMAFTKPLIAAVHGVAVGFGATILLHCDVVFVAEDARLRMPFTALGTAPEAGSSFLLPQQVGPQRAAEMLLTSRWLDGREAVTFGLASRCYPASVLHDSALALARQMASQPPEAVAAAKRLIRTGRHQAVQEALLRERSEAGHLGEVLGPLGRNRG